MYLVTQEFNIRKNCLIYYSLSLVLLHEAVVIKQVLRFKAKTFLFTEVIFFSSQVRKKEQPPI